ncbi:hypothetical protein BJ912DRAFT_986440 [Pholiota molesta]|nr:hypothetical protein BJ912DRAFT_986440 [Pholiota molesta]
MDTDEISDESHEAQSEVRTCPVKDCLVPIDIVLQSSDGIQFGTHLNNLQQYSEGFPLAESVMVDADIPILEETAEVIEIMLQFMHHTRQPDISKLEFDLLLSLAEAVEKYMIYSAMAICNVYISLNVKDHPFDALVYSVKHDYPELADKAAPLTLPTDSETVVSKAKAANLHNSFLVTWFRYRDVHAKAGRSLIQHPPAPGTGGLHKGGFSDCGLWEPYTQHVRISSAMEDFLGPQEAESCMSSHSSSLNSCSYCSKRGDHWSRSARNALADIPLFSSM